MRTHIVINNHPIDISFTTSVILPVADPRFPCSIRTELLREKLHERENEINLNPDEYTVEFVEKKGDSEIWIIGVKKGEHK